MLAAALLAGSHASAAPATWTPVAGQVRGAVMDAAADGPRVLVVSVDRRQVIVTTIRDRRVVRRQVVLDSFRRGTVDRARVLALPRGRALVVWSGVGLGSSLRPSGAARFGPATDVVRHPGVTSAVARGGVVTATPGGDVVAAWWGGPAGGRLGIWSSSLGAGGTWGAPREISAGTYPLPTSPLPPIVAVGAAASPDGGVAVAWRQPLPGASPAEPRGATIAGVTRSPSGAWGAPVALGQGDVTSFDLTVAAPAAGTVAAAWAESRAERPDGVTSTTCLVAAVATGSGPVARDDLTCRGQYSPGLVRLLRAGDGGLLAAWQAIPDYGAGDPLRAAIELFRRPPGAGAWAPAGLAVADTLGFWRLEAFAPLPAGGALVLSDLSQTVRGTNGRQVRAVAVADDGTVVRRVSGPTAPRPAAADKRLHALGSGAYRGVMAETLGGFPYRTRLTLLRLPQT